MPLKRSFSRLDPFVRGQIVGMRAAGAKREDIVKKVKKKDGRSPTIRAVDAVLAKHACDPQWHGGDSSAGGRPRPLCARTRAGLQPRAHGNAGALPASHVVVVGVSLRHAHARERVWAPCRWPGRLACM